MKSPGTASHKTSGKKAKKDGKFPGKGQLGRERRAERRQYKGEARREDASARREEADAAHRRAEAAHYQQEAAKAEREGYKKEAAYDLAKAAREQAEARRDMARSRHNEAKAKRNRHKAARVGLALPGAVSGGWILGGNGWHQGCAAVALANHLYAATGLRVSNQDVLGLYRLTADDPAQGASIQATLEAAAEYGLGGWHPVFTPAELLDALWPDEVSELRVGHLPTGRKAPVEPCPLGIGGQRAPFPVMAHEERGVPGTPPRSGPDDYPVVRCGPRQKYEAEQAEPHGVSILLDLRLQQAQRHQPVWDWEPSPDWGAHAGLLASDRVITWGREVPVTGDFLARQVVGAWSVEWPPVPGSPGCRGAMPPLGIRHRT